MINEATKGSEEGVRLPPEWGQGIGSNLAGVLQGFKATGLDGSKVVLGVMDGLPGLERVFREEFPNVRVQRCQVHVARNVLAEVPKKVKKERGSGRSEKDLPCPSADRYTSSKKKALAFFQGFKEKWGKDLPSAVKSLEASIDSCLTYLGFPEEEWISLRTTNIIERLNKEYKRRTRSMEILAGEQACYMPVCVYLCRCTADRCGTHRQVTGLHQTEDGVALEIKSYRKVAQQSSFLPETGGK